MPPETPKSKFARFADATYRNPKITPVMTIGFLIFIVLLCAMLYVGNPLGGPSHPPKGLEGNMPRNALYLHPPGALYGGSN